MKTYVYLMTFIFAFPLLGIAQSNRNEIQASFGPMTREHVVLDIFENTGRSIVREPLKKITFSKSYSVTYRYQTNNRLTIGFNTSIASGSSIKSYWFESRNAYTHKSFILSFEAKFKYLSRPNIELYYFGGAGGFVVREKKLNQLYNSYTTYAYPTLQVTPIGVRIGKTIGVFTEIGYGYKGVINLGLSGRF